MHLIKVDPRALKENPDRLRQTKSTPQADALLLATIKAVGIVQPPVITPEIGGGNGYVINAGHRRVKQAIAAGLEEIDVLVDEAANDNGAMRSMVTNIAFEPMNPVDQWRAIERLVALGWTEEAIGVALALPVRQIKKLRLLANVLPAMLDHMAKGDMPNEQQLRTIAAASLDEQKEVWKKHKPSKGDPQVSWWSVAQGLQKTRMFARHASFGDDLAQAYGIQWVEDLFAPADEDSRYTTNVEGFLGAQQEWMTANLPKKGVIAETTNWGEVKLPPKAERVYGKPTKSDCTAMYLDREGRVQSVHYRMPEAKKPKGGKDAGGADNAPDDVGDVSKPRPDVTRKGVEMIGDYRTDALREALGRAPIEDDALMALLILAFAGQNVSVTTGSGGVYYGHRRLAKNAAVLFDADGKLAFDMDTLRVAARTMLVDVFSCRENATNSGIVARIAGEMIGADAFLPNMGTEDFLSCLSRPALEGSCNDTPVLPRQRVKDTRAALVEHYKEGHFVHPSALFAPDPAKLSDWLSSRAATADEDEADEDIADIGEGGFEEDAEAFREAAEQRRIPTLSNGSPPPVSGGGVVSAPAQSKEDTMSAHTIFDNAPIGSIVAWSDGTPQPPARFNKKLAAWQTSNSRGRLIRKQRARGVGNLSLSACFTLHEADHGAGGVIAIRIHRTFSLDSSLTFTIVERPAIGLVRVFDRAGDDAELVYLATHETDAREWLTRHGYPRAVLHEVTADEVGADIVEGRTAA